LAAVPAPTAVPPHIPTIVPMIAPVAVPIPGIGMVAVPIIAPVRKPLYIPTTPPVKVPVRAAPPLLTPCVSIWASFCSFPSFIQLTRLVSNWAASTSFLTSLPFPFP